MNGIIYTRVSSDEQIKGMSLDFQREDCLRYARENNITILTLFEERGESAKFANRTELLNLLDYCRKHKKKVQALIVWKLDRLSRNQMDYYFLKRTLLGYGIAIHSATEPSLGDASSIAGKVFETFSALQAEIDNTIRRDRAVRGMAAKLASGVFPWQPPLGYTCARNRSHGVKKTEPDEPDPERFPLIQQLFRTCADKKVCGSVELAGLANTWGLTTSTGKKIYPQLIDRIFANRFYAGVLVDPWTKAEIRGRHTPAVTEQDFDLIQWLRSGKSTPLPAQRRPENPDFPLRRTVLCGSCLTPLTGSWSRGNGGRYAYYHCPNKRCELFGKATPKVQLEAEFEDELSKIAANSERSKKLTDAVIDTWNQDARLLMESGQKNKARVRDLEQRLQNLIGMKERDLVTDEEFLERKEQLKTDLSVARIALSEAHPVEDDVTSLTKDAERFLGSLPSKWLEMTPDQKRRFQKHVYPAGIPYRKSEGFGTAKLGLIYDLVRDGDAPYSRMVSNVRMNWNQILDDLREIGKIRTDDDSDGELAA